MWHDHRYVKITKILIIDIHAKWLRYMQNYLRITYSHSIFLIFYSIKKLKTACASGPSKWTFVSHGKTAGGRLFTYDITLTDYHDERNILLWNGRAMQKCAEVFSFQMYDEINLYCGLVIFRVQLPANNLRENFLIAMHAMF